MELPTIIQKFFRIFIIVVFAVIAIAYFFGFLGFSMYKMFTHTDTEPSTQLNEEHLTQTPEESPETIYDLLGDPKKCENRWDVDEGRTETPICTCEMVRKKQEVKAKELDKICRQNQIKIEYASDCFWRKYQHCEDILHSKYLSLWTQVDQELADMPESPNSKKINCNINNSDTNLGNTYINKSELEECQHYIYYTDITDNISTMRSEIDNIKDNLNQ